MGLTMHEMIGRAADALFPLTPKRRAADAAFNRIACAPPNARRTMSASAAHLERTGYSIIEENILYHLLRRKTDDDGANQPGVE